MRSERIFRAIADVGDDLVARAEKEAKHQPSAWLRWGALAACCVLVIGIAALALPHMGFGAKSEAAMDTAAQDAATEELSKAAPETMEMPAEAPAPDLQVEPSMAGAPAEEPAEADIETEEAPQVEVNTAILPLLERACAKIELRYDGTIVTITEQAEVDAVMDAIRALPLVHEDANVRGKTLQLYLYEADAQEHYAFIELPKFRVASADEYETGGEPAQDYCSFDADALYEALLAQYFPEK